MLKVTLAVLEATLLACLVSSTAAYAEETEGFEFSASRVLVVGDVHGAFDTLVGLLQANGVVDSAQNWTGGDTHLVSLGDLVDRGPQSRQVMDLFINLQQQAVRAGGRVHVVLGNHEVMNLLGDLRDVSAEDYLAYAPPSAAKQSAANQSTTSELTKPDARPPGYEEHRAAFAINGTYGDWLLQQPLALKINRTLFVHGGLSPLLGDTNLSDLNQQGRAQLKTAMGKAAAGESLTEVLQGAPLLGYSGPLWYRGSAACHPLLETPILTKQLNQLDADRLVVGHTPTATRTPLVRLQQRVFALDTGMLKSVYRGNPFLLELATDSVTSVDLLKPRVLDGSGKEKSPRWWHPVLAVEPQTELALAVSDIAEDEWSGEWRKAGKKSINLALARFRLDRELGVWMTPLVVADVEGKRFFEAVSGQWISERERRKTGRSYPNHCVQGHQNLLITVFDALTGVTNRSVDNLLWHRATGAARLELVRNAFGVTTKLGDYTTPPTLPPAVAERIANLNEPRLTELLGDLLTSRQIRAILARRDKVLLWPKTELAL